MVTHHKVQLQISHSRTPVSKQSSAAKASSAGAPQGSEYFDVSIKFSQSTTPFQLCTLRCLAPELPTDHVQYLSRGSPRLPWVSAPQPQAPWQALRRSVQNQGQLGRSFMEQVNILPKPTCFASSTMEPQRSFPTLMVLRSSSKRIKSNHLPTPSCPINICVHMHSIQCLVICMQELLRG